MQTPSQSPATQSSDRSAGHRVLFPLVFAFGAAAPAIAQTFPAKPIAFVVGLAPGGAADVTARMVAQRLGDRLGQQVIVENRTGAGGAIAMERVLARPADGYSLLVLTSSATALPALRGASLPFDMSKDFAPIALMASGPWVVVAHPSVPAKNIQDIIAMAKAQPGRLNYGSSGYAGATHLGGEYFNQFAQVNIAHVAYKGGSEAAVAVATGQVDLSYSTVPSVKGLLEAGRLKPLAVTSLNRSAALPNVPSLHESGLKGFEFTIWVGVLGRAGIPADIVGQLNKSINQTVNSAELKAALVKQGLDPRDATPEQFAALVRNEIEQNRKLVKAVGIKQE